MTDEAFQELPMIRLLSLSHHITNSGRAPTVLGPLKAENGFSVSHFDLHLRASRPHLPSFLHSFDSAFDGIIFMQEKQRQGWIAENKLVTELRKILPAGKPLFAGTPIFIMSNTQITVYSGLKSNGKEIIIRLQGDGMFSPSSLQHIVTTFYEKGLLGVQDLTEPYRAEEAFLTPPANAPERRSPCTWIARQGGQSTPRNG